MKKEHLSPSFLQGVQTAINAMDNTPASAVKAAAAELAKEKADAAQRLAKSRLQELDNRASRLLTTVKSLREQEKEALRSLQKTNAAQEHYAKTGDWDAACKLLY